MFTGLVAATGEIVEREGRGPGARLRLRGHLAGEPLELGESIAVDGVCLSVAEVVADGFVVDATAETLARTTLGGPPRASEAPGVTRRVNLERALRASDRLGGHLVTGHVDGVATLVERREVGDALELCFALPASLDLARFVAKKGSIAVNGTSLTVNRVRAASAGHDPAFDVTIIPITQHKTNLGALNPGDVANVEVDLFARYVAQWMGETR